MAELIIDTSVLIQIERENLDPDVLVANYPDDRLSMSSITVAELLYGVEWADSVQRRRLRQAFVERIIQLSHVVSFDLAAARHHARAKGQLFRAGYPIGAHDLLIAATTLAYGLAYGLIVLTKDLRSFPRVPDLAYQVFDD